MTIFSVFQYPTYAGGIGSLSKSTLEIDNETTWTEWESGRRTINFQLNYIDTEATVSKPGNPEVATGYMTNANQFGVTLKIQGQTYCYTFADGSSESSGVFFAIENNGSNSPYILRPNYPATNNGSFINPNQVRTDYDYYYADNMVKEETTVELATGEKFKFVQIIQFQNDGIFHRSYMTNIGDNDVDSFRMIAKVDTFFGNDYVPVYYGEMKNTYYLKQNTYSTKLRISGLTGVDGSCAVNHQRIWDTGFINTYRLYNENLMNRTGPSGTSAFNGGDSEVVFDQKPHTIAVGETNELVFAINLLQSSSVTVSYVNENGNEIAQTEFLQGIIGEEYEAARKDVPGYVLDTDRLPANEAGLFAAAEQYVEYVYKKVYSVIYDGNTNTGGTLPSDTNQYLSGQEATVLEQGDLQKDGYNFVGWSTEADGNGTIYKPGDMIEIADQDIHLYAVWENNGTNNSENNTQNASNNPQTGAVDNIALWVITSFAAGSVLLAIVIKRTQLFSKQ